MAQDSSTNRWDQLNSTMRLLVERIDALNRTMGGGVSGPGGGGTAPPPGPGGTAQQQQQQTPSPTQPPAPRQQQLPPLDPTFPLPGPYSRPMSDAQLRKLQKKHREGPDDLYGATTRLLGSASGVVPGAGSLAQGMQRIRGMSEAWDNFKRVRWGARQTHRGKGPPPLPQAPRNRSHPPPPPIPLLPPPGHGGRTPAQPPPVPLSPPPGTPPAPAVPPPVVPPRVRTSTVASRHPPFPRGAVPKLRTSTSPARLKTRPPAPPPQTPPVPPAPATPPPGSPAAPAPPAVKAMLNAPIPYGSDDDKASGPSPRPDLVGPPAPPSPPPPSVPSAPPAPTSPQRVPPAPDPGVNPPVRRRRLADDEDAVAPGPGAGRPAQLPPPPSQGTPPIPTPPQAPANHLAQGGDPALALSGGGTGGGSKMEELMERLIEGVEKLVDLNEHAKGGTPGVQKLASSGVPAAPGSTQTGPQKQAEAPPAKQGDGDFLGSIRRLMAM